MKQEHIFGIIIGCLFVSVLFLTFGYVKLGNELAETKRELGIYHELTMESWAKEQIVDFLGTDIIYIDMVSPFIYKVRLLNGTSFTLQKYEGSWHIKDS